MLHNTVNTDKIPSRLFRRMIQNSNRYIRNYTKALIVVFCDNPHKQDHTNTQFIYKKKNRESNVKCIMEQEVRKAVNEMGKSYHSVRPNHYASFSPSSSSA